MADPFPGSPERGPTIRPDSAGISPYADADLWRAVDELQAASRHFTKAVELLNRAINRQPVRTPVCRPVSPYPGALPLRDSPAPAAERAATLKPGETRS